MTILQAASRLRDDMLQWLQDQRVPYLTTRLKEVDIRRLEDAFLPPLGHDGLSATDSKELNRLLKAVCQQQEQSGICEGDCEDCCVTEILMSTTEQEFDPDNLDDESEFFGRLIDAAEDWLESAGFTAADFPLADRNNDDDAILVGSLYDSLLVIFAKTLGIDVPAGIAQNQNLPSAWTLTDDDAFQIRRQIQHGVYELYQIDAAGEDNKFRISHAVVYLKDYQADVEDVLNSYGYEDVKDLKDNYGDDWEGVLAEFCFETICQDGECLIEKRELTWEEAKELICKLSGYKEP